MKILNSETDHLPLLINKVLLNKAHSKILPLSQTLLKDNILYCLTLLFGLLLLSGCITTAVIDPELAKSSKIFTPEQLREDLKFIDQSIRTVHPEPFARFSSESYQHHYDKVYLELSWPQRRHNFYQLATQLVSKFSDLHTQLKYPSHEYNQFLQQQGQFPLAVLNSSEGLIVVADLQRPTQVPVGAELISINGVAISSILEKFREFVPAETESGQRRMIQVEFARLYWSLFPIENDYQVTYRWKGTQFIKTLKGVVTKSSSSLNATSFYGSMSINDSTALIWMNDFNEDYRVFEQFLENEFKDIEANKKSKLILDLRYNKGGITNNLALLLSYLTDKPVNWASEATLKLSKPFRETNLLLLGDTKNRKYGEYLDWLPVEYLNLWQWEVLFADDGEFLEFEIEPVVSKQQHRFTGDLYVLSNGYCYSACASLMATLKNNHLATIIGESPGSITDTQYGFPVELELPNTGLKLLVPAMKIVRLDETKGYNLKIETQYQVERKRKDVLSGNDPVLDRAIKQTKAP